MHVLDGRHEIKLQKLGSLLHDVRRDNVKRVAVYHQADGLRLRHEQLRAQRDSGVSAAAALGAADIVEVQPRVRDLFHAVDVAQRADGVGAAAGNLVVRTPQLLPDAIHLGVDVVVAVGVHEADVGVHEVFEQLVALALGHAALFEDQYRRHAQLFRAGRREHGVVRLRAAGREDDLRALPLRVGQQEFELAHLVAAETDAGQVVAFYIDVCAENTADVFKLLNGRRQHGQRYPRKIVQAFHIESPFYKYEVWLRQIKQRKTAVKNCALHARRAFHKSRRDLFR